MTAWLKQILGHALGHELNRHRGASRRHINREISIDQQLTESSKRLCSMLAAPDSSPSDRAVRREQEFLLVEVLERLPNDYREVIILRNLQSLPHEEVARQMNRTMGAAGMLWVRALAKLRREIDAANG